MSRDNCQKCEKRMEDMTYPFGVPQSDYHRELCVWCDPHYADATKCTIPVNLTDYIIKCCYGKKCDGLKVTSAIGTAGAVVNIHWVQDPLPIFHDFFDEDRSIVHIKWDNGSESYQSVLDLTNVIVKSETGSCVLLNKQET